MKQIMQLPMKFKRLKNAEQYQFHDSNMLYIDKVLGIPQLVVPATVYKTKFKKEEVVYKRDYKFDETDEIAVRDRNRDAEFNYFGVTTNFASNHAIPAIAARAKVMARIHHNYNKARYLPLGENTAQITNFLNDVDTEENREAIDALGLRPVITSMRENNVAIAALSDQRTLTAQELREEGSMSEVRDEVDGAYEVLVNVINSVYTVNEYGNRDENLSRLLEEIIDLFNAHIEQTRVAYARRTKRKVKSGSSQKPDAPDVPPAPVGPPVLVMTNQTFYGDSLSYSGCATHMSVDAVDAEAFTIALNGDITGAVLHMKLGEYWTDFPIVSLVTADGVPGLVITPPSPSLAFFKGIPSREEDLVEVVKDNMVIAMIEGVIFPSCVGQGRENSIPYLDDTHLPPTPSQGGGEKPV
jgi:hypothetical protein